MKIIVVNGSPKGEYSITLQTILYLKKLYKDYEFVIIHAAQQIKALEKDFSKTKLLLESGDAILFAYPVYTFLAPSQLHRFIELIKEHQVNLKDKYASQITTSKHFYDVTAHKYIKENILDLKMHYIRGLSADMEDLLCNQGKKEAIAFMKHFLWSIKEKVFVNPIIHANDYHPILANESICRNNQSDKKDIVIITDVSNHQSNLQKMITRFQNRLPYQSRIVNIHEYPF